MQPCSIMMSRVIVYFARLYVLARCSMACLVCSSHRVPRLVWRSRRGSLPTAVGGRLANAFSEDGEAFAFSGRGGPVGVPVRPPGRLSWFSVLVALWTVGGAAGFVVAAKPEDDCPTEDRDCRNRKNWTQITTPKAMSARVSVPEYHQRRREGNGLGRAATADGGLVDERILMGISGLPSSGVYKLKS